MRQDKILRLEQLRELRGHYPHSKIVHCHGVFDVLHAGHLVYFESARQFGDRLVVTITADSFVNKGPNRPFFNETVRAGMVAALALVDHVAISGYPTAVPTIEALKPHFYVKGPDYKVMSKDVTGAIFNEKMAVEKGGGQLVFTQDETHSSSLLINKFFSQWSDVQQKALQEIRLAGGYDRIEEVIDQISRESVLISGEPIVDTYVFCTPETISSKSPSISAKFVYEENYAGGILAIANHVADFVKETNLIISSGGEDYFSSLLKDKLDPRIELLAKELPGIPTPRKTRYITSDKAQRIFEMTNLRSDQWSLHCSKEICEELARKSKKTGFTILADFGHGFFEHPLLKGLQSLEGFVGLNVQTNSSNFGFNPFTKHEKFSYLSIDTREARIAYQDRHSATLNLAHRVKNDVRSRSASVSMTVGAEGAFYFPADEQSDYFSPAFSDSVIDTTGAGDAYFSLTCLLIKVDCPKIMVPFLGNIFAGLKTKIMGNKVSVTRAQLMKAVASILK